MAEGVLFTVAEEILKNMGSRALDKIAAAWGFKDRLERLKDTIETIKNVLLDAQEKQIHCHAVRGWLLRLQAVVYDADDLFDEIATVASKKEAMEGNKSKKVRVFFSRSNPIALAFTISQKIKSIKEDLDTIVNDRMFSELVIRPSEEGLALITGKLRGETGSFIHKPEVVGREEDKNVISDILLDSSNNEEVVSIVPIVGMGGLGKTTVAQLLYNDKIVKQHFELRLWVCVGEDFDEKEIVKKILMSATKAEPQNLGMDQLQSQLRQAIGGRKYLLVLDDVWSECREKWVKLSDLLKDGKEGSKILVTTRSSRVAKIMGTVPAYLLGGLSPEKSWDLFQKVAFEPGQEQNSYLFEAGKEIVKICCNVPLAIRTLGSLLYGQDERKWLSIKNCGRLSKLSDEGNDIMPILKLSYNHLTSALKHCFAYCALFPKDYVFHKETMISLWMAEGFLLPKNGSQRQLEDVGEDYFATLVQRCFFQGIVENEWGNIGSCKVHDLLHDLAKEVAGAESTVARFEDTHLDEGIRRLSLGYRMKSTQNVPGCVLGLKHLRTFLLPEQVKDGSIFSKSRCSQLISNFRCLRVLDLNNVGAVILPSSIGKLTHLRYLNLSHNLINTLPSSITNLQNLQTLNLNKCKSLGSLPKDIRKLSNLRSLDVGECEFLKHMPEGMGALTSLYKLNYFVVVGEDPSEPRSCIGQLRDIKNLNSLKGQLVIEFRGEIREPVIEAKESNMSSKHGVIDLCLKRREYYYISNEKDKEMKHDEAILEGLKPHPNLKKLEINCWRGEKLPSWVVMDNLSICLPNLVHISFCKLRRWKELPSFGQLKFLKHLSLNGLGKVEYIEDSSGLSREEVEQGPPSLFFPSLQVLQLQWMKSLKGWWKHGRQQEEATESWMSFSNVSNLKIKGCPELKLIPMCPNVKELELVRVNEELIKTVLKMASQRERAIASLNGSSSSSPPSISNWSRSVQLKTLKIDNVQHLIRLPKECLQHLTSLEITDDTEVESTMILEQVFETSLPCLRQLSFSYCSKLKAGTSGLQHLTALEHLCFYRCYSLTIEEEANEDGMPWKALSKNLLSLKLSYLEEMKYLPEGVKYLTNLRSLDLSWNKNLVQIPKWIGCLSSLQFFNLENSYKVMSLSEGLRRLTNLNTLDISHCHRLTKQCQDPTGKDLPNIQHIPLVVYDN